MKPLERARTDLKPDNIVVVKEGAAWQATLIDLGLAHYTAPGESAPRMHSLSSQACNALFLGCLF